MKFTAAVVLAAAAGAQARYAGNYTVVTETVTALTTFCPEATTISMGSKTYTVTEATTLTITDCPCTQTRTVPHTPAPTGFTNSTVAAVPAPTGGNANPGAGPGAGPGSAPAGTGAPAGNTGPSPTGPIVPTTVPTAGAGKAAVLSGAGLAGLVGLAAFLL